jgi:hypothetical protein
MLGLHITNVKPHVELGFQVFLTYGESRLSFPPEFGKST